MTEETPFWTLDELVKRAVEPVMVISTNSVANMVKAYLPFPIITDFSQIPEDIETLVAVGGGTLIDSAKIASMNREIDLIAIPSLWGSGAEVSPITVFVEGGVKSYSMDNNLRPIARSLIPELTDLIPDPLVRFGCGDAWAHLLEGSLSPLASSGVRRDGAELIREILNVGVNRDVRWFELSAKACLLQSKSSVGLIHGISHTLEIPLISEFPEEKWGHARLCSVFLWPVFQMFIRESKKWKEYVVEFDLDETAISSNIHSTFELDEYLCILGHLRKSWDEVIRHPFTRTNFCVVRHSDIERFTEGMV